VEGEGGIIIEILLSRFAGYSPAKFFLELMSYLLLVVYPPYVVKTSLPQALSPLCRF
jgi:hypothetical protein